MSTVCVNFQDEIASRSGGNGRWLVCARPPVKENDRFNGIADVLTSKSPQTLELDEWQGDEAVEIEFQWIKMHFMFFIFIFLVSNFAFPGQ